MRETLTSFIDDYCARGAATWYVHHRGLRTVRWSYRRAATTANQVARELEARGIARGERVLLWAENSPEWVAAFWGCVLRGAVVVPLDKESAPDFAARVQAQVEARLLLASDEAARRASERSELNIPTLRLEELSSAVAHHSGEAYPCDTITDETLVEIIFTSGTTAEPKGVLLTHRNLLANLSPLEAEIAKYIKWERLVHPIRFLNLVPLSHIFGQFMGMFVPPLIGGEVFFQESLNPSEIVRTTKRERISIIVAVPRILDALREHTERSFAARGAIETFRQSLATTEGRHFLWQWWKFREVHRRFGWKFWAFVSGGATLDSETETFWRRLGYAVLQGYGMTETASLISVNHPFKLSRGSIGKTLPGYEVRLGEGGEIMVRGPSVSPGYWTEEGRASTNPDGWLPTGDIGWIDDKGNLFFKGRKKDTIVTAAGLNIHPEDLEAALNRQPEVRLSTVISIEGARGPEPLAVLILRIEGADVKAAVSRANEALATHQQLRRWFVWPERDFPRTSTQKILKREVAAVVAAQMKAEGEAGTVKNEDRRGEMEAQTLATPALSSSILSFIARTSGDAPAQVDASANLTTDLKLDSLGRVELLSWLEERYQVELDEAAFTSATTLGDVEKVVQGSIEEPSSPYPYPKWPRRFPVTWIRFVLFYLMVLPITRVMSRMRVVGRERLEQLPGPALFVANHVTYADHALILAALPARLRHRLAIAMEGEILRDWRHPPAGTKWPARLRWLIQYELVVTFFHVFPLPKQSGFRQSFTYAGASIDRGDSVLVFPEGQRSQHAGMNRFMIGTGLLAKKLDVPVVPVKLSGLYELKQKRQYFANDGDVSVTFGEPVKFKPEDDPADIAQELEQRVAQLNKL